MVLFIAELTCRLLYCLLGSDERLSLLSGLAQLTDQEMFG